MSFELNEPELAGKLRSRSVSSLAITSARAPRAECVGLLAAITLALWLTCLGVDAIGLMIPYPWPTPPPPTKSQPVPTELLNVEIGGDPPPEVGSDAPGTERMPASPLPPPVADIPPLPSIGEPTPALAFSLPAAGPTQVAVPSRAELAGRAESEKSRPTLAHPGSLKRLTYGRGEGIQPAPEYPREAIFARQEGSVAIRFIVDDGGGVVEAEISSPSPWPLLNQSALRAVRETWHFSAGRRRAYEVSIDFGLRQR